jgi:hypothetical protein
MQSVDYPVLVPDIINNFYAPEAYYSNVAARFDLQV